MPVRTTPRSRTVKPIEKLSRGALEALVKLLVASKGPNKVLVPSISGKRYYDELVDGGYAYHLFSGGVTLNGDTMASGSLLKAVGLRK